VEVLFVPGEHAAHADTHAKRNNLYQKPTRIIIKPNLCFQGYTGLAKATTIFLSSIITVTINSFIRIQIPWPK
jgi:hypothetical protein